MRLAFLSSTPASATEGSGTFVALDGLLRGLTRLGHEVDLRPLRVRTGFHTLDRWLYNVGVASRPPAADVVVGVDLDGFLWARPWIRGRGAFAGPPAPDGRATKPRVPFVVALKGVIADELRNEHGLVRALLEVQARWERSNCARADRVVVPSRYSAGVAAAAYGIPQERLTVVPEPVDLSAWRALFAAAPAGRATRPTVLAVARMYPRKRLQDLLEATALLAARIPEVEVRIVGRGPESARLREAHARLGLGERVVFLGDVPRSTLAVEYVRAHCFCLPTVQEGFGIAFAEAMAAGLPIVACRAAAVPEVVDDGRTGLLVEPRRPAALAVALERLLTDEVLRKRLGEEGMRRVAAWDLEPVAARFLEAVPA